MAKLCALRCLHLRKQGEVMATYEGWANRQTWNVALWINNEYNLYKAAVNFAASHPATVNLYKLFIKSQGMENDRTPDNIAYISTRLNYKELNAMMRELVS